MGLAGFGKVAQNTPHHLYIHPRKEPPDHIEANMWSLTSSVMAAPFCHTSLFMINISYGKVSIVEGAADETWYVLCTNGIFNCVEELQIGFLEYVLKEIP